MTALKPITDLPDGIYFDLPESIYHGINRLSASGIRSMMISPATFWHGSWLNPDLKEDEDTAARRIGSAYHCALFRPDALHDEFIRDLTKDEMPEGTLITDAHIKDKLKDMGLPQTQAGEGVLERAWRLKQAGYAKTPIWHLARLQFDTEAGDRVTIPPKAWDDMLKDLDRIKSNREIDILLQGGQGEVTILWNYQGLPVKTRVDFLRHDLYLDLKTFDNSRGIVLHKAIANAVQFNRYYVQQAFYALACDAVRCSDLPIRDTQREVWTAQGLTPDDRGPVGIKAEHVALIKAIRDRSAPLESWMLFQEKKGIPNVVAYRIEFRKQHPSLVAAAPDAEGEAMTLARYGEPSQLFTKAVAEIDYAVRSFRTYSEVYEDGGPWFPLAPVQRLGDDDFSLNWLASDW